VTIDDQNLPVEKDIYKSEFFLIQDVDPILCPDGRAITRTFITKDGKSLLGIWDPGFAYNGNEDGIVWYNGTYYKGVQAGTNQEPATQPTYWTPIPEKDVWDIKSRPMYGIITVDVFSVIEVALTTPENITRIINNTGISWEDTYPLHYRVFNRIIDRTKVVDELIKLNYADVNQLDFSRSKIIDNEVYLLQGVNQFKLNQTDSTICELVRL
jgi:hypothetical protein